MRVAQPIRLGALVLIILNIAMAFAALWVFLRMSPAIELIMARNERSLQACEEMLAALVLYGDTTEADRAKGQFVEALDRARKNITESEEPFAIQQIERRWNMLTDSAGTGTSVVESVQLLSEINRKAMNEADRKARQFGNAGAWIIVTMALIIFSAGLIFITSLQRAVIDPLEEIFRVVADQTAGNFRRRCTIGDYPREMKRLLRTINQFLDQKSSGNGERSGLRNRR